MLFTLYLIACIGSMILLFRLCCLRRGGVHINAVFGLLIGLSFYVLLPSSLIYYYNEYVAKLTVYSNELSPDNVEIVMLFTVALLTALSLGAGIWQVVWRRRRPVNCHNAGDIEFLRERWKNGASWPATLTMSVSLLLFMVKAFTVRGALFAGYDAEILGNNSVWAARGTMSSAYSMFYVAMCVFILRRRNSLSKLARWMLILTFVFSSMILLSMGARLYVAMALLSLLALKSALSDGIKIRRLAVFLIGGALLMGSVGVLRTGSLQGLASVMLNVLLEPLLTGLSLYTLLANNGPIWIGQVHMIFPDFMAMVPSALYPAKSGLFERLHTYGYSFEAPIGGYHLYFSGLINFGYVGMCLVALWAGYVLARVSRRPLAGPLRASTLMISVYLCGALAFTVFRDPFFIAIAKNVLIMGIALPILLNGFKRRDTSSLRATDIAVSA